MALAMAMAMASTSGMSMATASGLASSFCTTTRSAALSSRGSELRGLHFAASSSSSSACCSAPSPLLVQPIAKRVCDLTGKKANNGYKVSFSNHRTKKLQGVNLQYKRLWWEEKKRFVRLRISTKALKTIEKKGLSVMAKEAGIDLNQY